MSDEAKTAGGPSLQPANLNGRRLERAYRLSRMRVHRPEPGNSARTAVMAPRAERRLRVKELRANVKRRQPELNRHTLRESFPFRPVLGYVGPAKKENVG